MEGWPLADRARLAVLSSIAVALAASVGAFPVRSVEAVEPPIGSAELYNPASKTWSPAASMAIARDRHTATFLDGGKVLVVGGEGGDSPSGITRSAELYDPRMNTWTNAAWMSSPRFGHTATRLRNGKVLVAGGQGPSIGSPTPSTFSTTELYDPVTNTWSSGASMRNARVGHTATLLADGKVIVVGGFRAGATAELYDPERNLWSEVRSPSNFRYGHTTTLLADGRVLIVGGGPQSRSSELYDPVTDTWAAAAPMAGSRTFHTATLLETGMVLVVGGSENDSVERYDPLTNSWSAAGRLSTGRPWHTSTRLTDGNVLVAGGGGSTAFRCLASEAELYDWRKNAWSGAGATDIARTRHTATLLADGRILFAGGGTTYQGSGCFSARGSTGGSNPLRFLIRVTLAGLIVAATGVTGLLLARLVRRRKSRPSG